MIYGVVTSEAQPVAEISGSLSVSVGRLYVGAAIEVPAKSAAMAKVRSFVCFIMIIRFSLLLFFVLEAIGLICFPPLGNRTALCFPVLWNRTAACFSRRKLHCGHISAPFSGKMSPFFQRHKISSIFPRKCGIFGGICEKRRMQLRPPLTPPRAPHCASLRGPRNRGG